MKQTAVAVQAIYAWTYASGVD